MAQSDDRIEELIAAAVAGDLGPSERAELDRLRSRHPWIDGEIESLRAIAGRLDGAEITWETSASTDALRERILSEIPSAGVPALDRGPAEDDARIDPNARRRWVAPVLAAACLAAGLAIGFTMPALTSIPPSGPPGTLGAVEAVDVRDEAVGVAVDADIVAHTWGTEVVLDATGLDVGATYAIIVVAADGSEFPAGEILGSQGPIHCRVNAAVLREDAARLEIRDPTATVVAGADLPEV